MSTQISVSGLIINDLIQSLLDRLSNHTHSFSTFDSREILFHRGPLEPPIDDSNILRLNHTTRSPELADPQSSWYLNNPTRNGWTLTSLGRIEPERISPDFCIRPSYVSPIIDGNPIEFLSALGYRRKFEFYKRGVQFIRGSLTVEIFRLFKTEACQLPIADPTVHLITITAIIPSATRSTATNSGPTAHELRSEACARIRELQAILQGLVDLGRVDPS